MADMTIIQDDLNTNAAAKSEFATDPKAYLAKHGIQISPETHDQLKTQLATPGINTNAISVGITVGT